MDYKIGSEYYIRDNKGNLELPQRMMARLCGDRHEQGNKEIRGGSRVRLLSESPREVRFGFDGQKYVTPKITFARFASEELSQKPKPKGE